MKAFGCKPDKAMWEHINKAFLDGHKDQNAGVVTVTLLSGAEEILFSLGVCPTREAARAHLAAMLISPNEGRPGSLMPELEAELRRLGWEKPS